MAQWSIPGEKKQDLRILLLRGANQRGNSKGFCCNDGIASLRLQ